MKANRTNSSLRKSLVTAGLTLSALAGMASLGCDRLASAAGELGGDKAGRIIPCCPSSERFKEDIAPIQDALDKVMRLQGVSFTYKPEFGGRRALGFIAEHTANVLPETVGYDKEGRVERMNYVEVVPVTVEAIKQLAAENARLEQRLAQLEARGK